MVGGVRAARCTTERYGSCHATASYRAFTAVLFLLPRQAASKVGFCMKPMDPKSNRYSYSDFQRVFNKWQDKLGVVFVAGLRSAEFIQVKNTISVLQRIVTVFPTSKRIGGAIMKRIAAIKDDADMPDDMKVPTSCPLVVSRRSLLTLDD